MLEIIAVLLIAVAVVVSLIIVTSIFMAYATQANYVDEKYSDDD